MEKDKEIDRRLLSRILSERLSASEWHSFSPTDWESIVHLSRAEGVGPLLYRVLLPSERIGLLPRPLQAALRAMYFSTRMKNEQIIQELGALTSLFARAGIPVVALKGVCCRSRGLVLEPGGTAQEHEWEWRRNIRSAAHADAHCFRK